MTARVVIGGVSSGAGKTTIASGLLAALRERGHVTTGFKVGPDFIDPSFHALASGRPGRNLDAFLQGPELIAPLFRHGSEGADLAVIEGVMGLFDGASGRGELASTAHVAKLLHAPVVLVVDAAAMARSVAATVHGYASFDPELNVGGVILNRVGSDAHEEILREALEPLGIPVLGALRRDDAIAAPERHLGLVPVAEREARSRAAIDALAVHLRHRVDLDAVVALARSALAIDGPAWSPGEPVETRARVAVAGGPAFSFHYAEHRELLEAAGAEVVPFDPLADEQLPARTGAIVLAGGFPEEHATALSENWSLRAEVSAFAHQGGPVLAECGGLLYLARDLDGHAMCDVLPCSARMTDRLTLGYREATAIGDHPAWPAGTRTRGHEFHYSTVQPGAGAAPAWEHKRGLEGHVQGNVHASYLHTHWAATPEVATRLVDAAEAFRPLRRMAA